jgi:hypothetical protein
MSNKQNFFLLIQSFSSQENASVGPFGVVVKAKAEKFERTVKTVKTSI